MRLGHVAAAAAAALVGCQLISGASQDQFSGSGGASLVSSGSGTGVTSSQSSASGGASSTSGSGGAGACKSAADCPGKDTGCVHRACDQGMCAMANVAKDTACAEDGGKFCDGAGLCVECNHDPQCASDQYCSSVTHQCRNKDCTDGKIDGGETDLDCGGVKCDGCTNGKSCLVGADCKSGYCKGAGGSGSGGAGGGPPTKGACGACTGDGDCAGLPGSYCNQGTCTPKKKLGVTCADKSQCASGYCTDGVCCATACAGACLSCVAKDTAVVDRTCAPVRKGTDPAAECAMQAMSSCGSKGVGCNGSIQNPHCIDWDAGTSCATSKCKDADNVIATGSCDGNGTCAPGNPTPCSPYKCANDACLKACAGDGECATGHYCKVNVCTMKLAAGAPCGAANQCGSGFCADGFCCDGACTAACSTCAKAAGATADGTCTAAAVKSKADAGTCDTMTGCATPPCTCNGSGVCKSANGAGCAASTDCASNFCPFKDKVCCDTSCNQKCTGCKMADFTGMADGTCANVMNGQDPFLDCNAGKKCNGAGVCQ